MVTGNSDLTADLTADLESEAVSGINLTDLYDKLAAILVELQQITLSGLPLPVGAATEATLLIVRNLLNIYVDNEVPVGDKNGINKVFTTQYSYKPNTVKLFLNGIRVQDGVGNDYTENGGNEIEFSIAPISGDVIIVDYVKLS